MEKILIENFTIAYLLKIRKNMNYNNNNILMYTKPKLDLSLSIKMYPFDIERNLIIDDRGLIYNTSNNNTIVGLKNLDNGSIKWYN